MWLKNDYAIVTSRQPCIHRIINDTLINQFSHALGETNWSQAYSALSDGDVNTAYKSVIAEYKTI